MEDQDMNQTNSTYDIEPCKQAPKCDDCGWRCEYEDSHILYALRHNDCRNFSQEQIKNAMKNEFEAFTVEVFGCESDNELEEEEIECKYCLWSKKNSPYDSHVEHAIHLHRPCKFVIDHYYVWTTDNGEKNFRPR